MSREQLRLASAVLKCSSTRLLLVKSNVTETSRCESKRRLPPLLTSSESRERTRRRLLRRGSESKSFTRRSRLQTRTSRIKRKLPSRLRESWTPRLLSTSVRDASVKRQRSKKPSVSRKRKRRRSRGFVSCKSELRTVRLNLIKCVRRKLLKRQNSRIAPWSRPSKSGSTRS